MGEIYYSEDIFQGLEVDESEIAKCTSRETLLGWFEDLGAVLADIKTQVEVAALGGHADPVWVYKASKAAGLYRRARSRVEARLKRLGSPPEFNRDEIAELHRKLAEAKARGAVAIEFLRLCESGGMSDRQLFSSIEAEAVECVEARLAKASARMAA